MSVVLVVEPDPVQAEVLRKAVRRIDAELLLVSTTGEAIAAMRRSVPDLVLVSALLSPRDEDALFAHLRTLEGLSHLQTLTIPQLRRGKDSSKKGAALFRKKGADAESGGCDPALFAEQGEAGYRKLEEQALRELFQTLEDEPAVIALGGGAFLQEPIRQIIRDHSASVVYLDVGLEEALHRCAAAPGYRPLLQDRDQVTLLYEERLPFYRTADLEVRTDGKTPLAVAQEIAARGQLSPRDQEDHEGSFCK